MNDKTSGSIHDAIGQSRSCMIRIFIYMYLGHFKIKNLENRSYDSNHSIWYLDNNWHFYNRRKSIRITTMNSMLIYFTEPRHLASKLDRNHTTGSTGSEVFPLPPLVGVLVLTGLGCCPFFLPMRM